MHSDILNRLYRITKSMHFNVTESQTLGGKEVSKDSVFRIKTTAVMSNDNPIP